MQPRKEARTTQFERIAEWRLSLDLTGKRTDTLGGWLSAFPGGASPPLETKSSRDPLLGWAAHGWTSPDEAGDYCEAEISLVIGINQTNHSTNQERPCTTVQ